MDNSYFMFDTDYVTYPNIVMLLRDVITVYDGINDLKYLETIHPGMKLYDQ